MSTTVYLAAEQGSGLLEQQLRDYGFEIAGPDGHADVVIAGDRGELERWCDEAPVIVLGGADDKPRDRVLAFRSGCDDYVPRPFNHEELVERIRAVVRRSRRAERVIELGELRVDEIGRVATVGGIAVKLSHKEFELLARLASDPSRVFTRSELLRDVWNWPPTMRTRTLDAHASRLRRKLRAFAPSTPYIDNEWGVGYRLIGLHPE
ncbi:MAG TPA: response regulator transcription factor [Gaiellaceae bacterium]|jgi:DNA-binding response OmpR family regulator|nr:response regulator transcription factor [Gaiellaceae bacterium]